MSEKNFMEQSKIAWRPAEGLQISHEQMQIGCLQRIALATENMTKSYTELEADRDWYKKRYIDKDRENTELRNTIRSLRAWVTRWKNKAGGV